MVSAAGNMVLVVGMLTAVVVYLWIYRWRQRNFTGPKLWPFFGCYFEVMANLHRIHDWCYDYMKRSPTATMEMIMGGQRTLFIGWPDNVEHILKSNFPNYIKGPVMAERLGDLLGNGIFNADGEVWKQHRKIASFEFSSLKLRESSTDAYREHGLRLVHFLDAVANTNKQVNIQDLFLRMTMDSICKIGFGVDQHNLSPDLPEIQFANAFDTLSAWLVRRNFDVAWKLKQRLGLGVEKKFRALLSVVENFTYSVIAERREELKKLEVMNQSLDRYDLLSRFMTSKDKDGEPLSDKVLRDAVLNFMIAGRDTSAVSLSWFVYMLCRNPHVAEKCFEELCEVVGGLETDDEEETNRYSIFADRLTYETLGKLHYIHASLSETLRLYPAVPRDGKFAVKDDVLPDGTIVQAHDTINYHPYAMGRLESLWGPDALQYRPERWIKDGVYHAESPFKFTAFQAGPRICLGKDTAYLQMKMTAALIVRFFRFHLDPDQHITYRLSLVMPIRDGLHVTVSKLG